MDKHKTRYYFDEAPVSKAIANLILSGVQRNILKVQVGAKNAFAVAVGPTVDPWEQPRLADVP